MVDNKVSSTTSSTTTSAVIRQPDPTQTLSGLLANQVNVGLRMKTIDPATTTFDPADPNIQQEVIAMISQYMEQLGYHASALTIQDECNVKMSETNARRSRLKRLKKAILGGEWLEVDKFFFKNTTKHYKPLLYAVYKQQYLELIDRQEYQKAYTFLNKKLKPYESLQSTSTEFSDLCYLLTCKSVQEAESFRDWQGVVASREKLCESFKNILDAEAVVSTNAPTVPPNRFVTLLQQAVAYQIEFSRNHPKTKPVINSILTDYSCLVVPNAHRHTFVGHTENIKCLDYIGETGLYVMSGSSDHTLRIWFAESGECLSTLHGHSSRIWSVSCDKEGKRAVSGSADSTIKIWQLRSTKRDETETSTVTAHKKTNHAAFTEDAKDDTTTSRSHASPNHAHREDGDDNKQFDGDAHHNGVTINSPCSFQGECVSTVSAHKGDVYTVNFHPAGTHVVSGGYDGGVQFIDLQTEKVVRGFVGHTASVCSAVFNNRGSLIVTGGKDSTVRLWDIVSGVCVKTISSHLGEVTSVDLNAMGTQLLSGSKDNSNRLWDIRMNRPLKRFKGHQNTTKNFIRCSFGPMEALVVGGSEDGHVYIWDVETSNLLQRLRGHSSIVFDVKWNSNVALLSSCGNDNTLRTWYFDHTKPYFEQQPLV